MKAILVIDIPDDFTIKGSYANCTIFEGGKHRMWNRITEIKPVPQKRILPKEMTDGTNYGEEPWFSDGFNACLDEILGEKQ